jgi:hypothetical protein
MVAYVVIGSQGWDSTSSRLPGELSGWCERVSTGLFREPVNALSNLGFMVVGLVMLLVLSRDPQDGSGGNAFIGYTPVSLLYAGASIWLGPGSMLMHGTHTDWGGWADNLSMVMYIIIPWLINVGEMGRWHHRRLLTTYALIVLVYAIARWFYGGRLGIGLDLFGLSIGLWGISELLLRFWSPSFRWLSGFAGFVIAAVFGIMPWDMLAEPANYWWVTLFWIPALFSSHAPRYRRRYAPWYVAGAGTYAAAFAIWLTGRPDHPWCQPDSLVQAHGIWHLLSAVATLCFFMFFRTQKRLDAVGSELAGGKRP